jgi:hypothetical protein
MFGTMYDICYTKSEWPDPVGSYDDTPRQQFSRLRHGAFDGRRKRPSTTTRSTMRAKAKAGRKANRSRRK